MKKLLILSLISITAYPVFAQKNSYISMETALTNDKYEFKDNSDNVLSVSPNSYSWGFRLGYDLNEFVSLETGLIRKYYNRDLGIRTSNVSIFSSGGLMEVWQIPLRIRSKINLLKDNISVTPIVGYNLCINSGDRLASTSTGQIFENDVKILTINSTSTYGLTKTFSLVEAGLGFEFRVRDVYVTFSASYFTGFKKEIQTDVDYTLGESAKISAAVRSKAAYSNFGIGFRVPLLHL